MEVLTFPTLSDHFPVIITLNNLITQPREKGMKWKDKQMLNYFNSLEFSPNVGKLQGDLDFLDMNLSKTITETSEILGMFSSGSIHRNKNPWFDSDCVEAKKELKNSLKNCKSESFSDNTKRIFDMNKKIYKQIIIAKNCV